MAGDIRELMGKELLFCDGAMGTMIQAKGIEPGQIPELWNVTEPAAIKDIHRQFLETGVNVIETNTFGANGFKLEGSGYTVEEIVSAGVENAREEADRIKDRPCFVSLSIGPLGKLLKPLGDVTFEEAYDQFAEMVKAGRRADLIIIETMNDTYELKAAILAAKENSDLPVFVSTILDEKGKLLTGAGIEAVVAMAEGLGVDALGFNCGMGPAEMKGFLPELVEATSLPILFSPNAGMPKIRDGQTVFETGPNEFAEHMKDLVAGGVCLAGGCCGTTPEHIKAMIDRCRGMSPVPPVKKDRTVVSSYEKAVTLGEEPAVIGERINPTGKAALKAALKEGDREYVLKEALSQQAQGAHILDINVGLPEIDERKAMEEIVPAVQAVTSLPLQIDTADPKAMEAALRLYNGKAMINSVNGKAESMDAVFPLVKKYGGVCVCLALDEEGIPETAEGRVAVIEKIAARAAEYGIERKDLVADTLTTTISTGEDNGSVTLDALSRVRHGMGMNTVLGVSNISFGLPCRDHINSIFLTLALENGLSAGIIDPGKEKMMQAYRAFMALRGLDRQGLDYIKAYGGKDGQEKPHEKIRTEDGGQDPEKMLYDSILNGLVESAGKCTEELLGKKAPMDIIDEDLIPALDHAGRLFEEKEIFLPQLLMTADATKAAFDRIKENILGSGRAGESKGKILLATVKGDIHDIGKNIVKVLLENYGYDVIDMGKDVPPEDIVDRVIGDGIRLVGLSALMTTTVVSMEETVKMLREAAPGTKVMVGGAVLTQEYADTMGADKYSADAMGSVRYANELFGG